MIFWFSRRAEYEVVAGGLATLKCNCVPMLVIGFGNSVGDERRATKISSLLFFFFPPPRVPTCTSSTSHFFVISQHILICFANLSLISWSTVVFSKNETTLLLVLFIESSSISTDSNKLMRRRPLVGGATQKIKENTLDFLTARDGQVPQQHLIESPQTPFSFQTDGGRRRG